MPKPRGEVSSAFVILRVPDKKGVLVVLSMKKKWMLPGGLVDWKPVKGKTDPSAQFGAARELREESGYKIDPNTLRRSKKDPHIFYGKADSVDWDKEFSKRKQGETLDYGFVRCTGYNQKTEKFEFTVFGHDGKTRSPIKSWRNIGEGKQFYTALVKEAGFPYKNWKDAMEWKEKADKAKAKAKLQLPPARPPPAAAGVPAVRRRLQADRAAACPRPPAPTVTDYANAEFMKSIALALSGFVMGSAAMMAAQYNS